MSIDPKRSPSGLAVENVSAALQRFVDDKRATFESTVDNLVRVRVGRSMNVVSVELLDPELDRTRRAELETACVAALNAAIQKAALAAGQALAEIEQKVAFGRGDTSRL